LDVAIDLPWQAYLPRDYVPGQRLRIEVYRRLARVRRADRLDDFRQELRDRFGPPPEPADWLLRMAACDADMVLGVAQIPSWRNYPAAVARRYLRSYRSKGPGHDHIHGANMGFRADAYWSLGGFAALASGEDVDLVRRFESAHMRIHRDAKLSVATSVRQAGRAPGGFAQHLRELSGPAHRRKASVKP